MYLGVPAFFSIVLLLAGCVAPLNPSTRSAAAQRTPDPTTQAIIAAVQAAGEPTTAAHASPDGQWRVRPGDRSRAADGYRDVYAYETVSLARTDGVASVVDSQLINCGGLGAYGFDDLFWSADNRYFYYTTAREGVPDGCGDLQPPLRRVDVATGARADVSAGDPAPDAAVLTAWLEQHQVRCAPTP